MSLLLSFDAAARHLSFTRAASELSLTQSAVSRQVQSLETLLQVPLFRREGRRIVLTLAGAIYQRELSPALQRIRNASMQAVASRSGGGSFHLAALPTFAAKWLMPRLNGFYAKHAGTLVHLHARIGQFDLELAGIDVVIGVGDGDWPGLIAHRLFDEHLLPVVSPALAETGTLRRPADLSNHLLLQVAGRVDVWPRWFDAQKIPRTAMQIGPQFELTSHLIQAIASGLGVGLVPDFLVQEELQNGTLRLAFDLPLTTGLAYYLFIPESKIHLPPIAAFKDWLINLNSAELIH